MTGQRLRVRARPEPKVGYGNQNWTLFARLSSQVARAFNSVHDAPQFLSLCLTCDGIDDPIYVSYNGGAIEEEDCIEVAAGTVPESITHVSVAVATTLPDAVAVEVEPLTISDWESLEVYAKVLEDGGLLQQVSVVYPQQILVLRVANSEIVRVRVHTNIPCRLMADTEIHIRPKPRQRKKKPSVLLTVVPSWHDYSPAMQSLALESDVEGCKQIHVAPCTVLVHPSTLETCGFEVGSIVTLHKGNATNNKEMAVARVQSSNLVAEDSIVLHKLLRYQLDVSPLFDCIRLESKEIYDLSSALEMVMNGSLSLSLERVGVIDCSTDNETPWRIPAAVPPRPQWHDPSKGNMEIPYLVKLCSIMASWLDLSDNDKELAMSPGSLVSVPWQQSSERELAEDQTIYRLLARPISEERNEEDVDVEPVYVLAKDLPYLLLESSSAGCRPSTSDDLNRISLSTKELSLNLLPLTPNVSTEDSSELFTNLTGDLECFDSIILTGDLGSGKTHSALILAAHARLAKGHATLYLDCKRLQSSSDVRIKDMLQALTDVFQEVADAERPCLVILDDVDQLIPNVLMGASEDEGSAHQQQPNPVAIDQAKLLGDHLKNLMQDACNVSEERVVVVMTARDVQSIHPELVSCCFYRSVNVPSFHADDRSHLFAEIFHRSTDAEVLQDFGKRTEGFRPRDLEIVAARVSIAMRNCNLVEAVDNTLNGYVPISLQGVRAEDVSYGVTWSQVGGLFRAKEHLSSTILHPVKYHRIYQHAPIRLPRGILLFGPPGCGKSYLVPALAKECRLTLITCRGPELLDKYIGASEAKVRQLFHRAYAAAPSLLFLDEFDALAPVRGSDHTGVTDRVVNQLLTYLDGVEDAAMGSVYIVAATSRPDKVDPALLRPGRLEQHVYVGFPCSREEWHSVLEQSLSGHSIETRLQEDIRDRKLWEMVGAAHVRSFSPSDIKAVVDTAYLNAVHDFLASDDGMADVTQDITVTIQMRHMLKALKNTRPSLSLNDRRMLDYAYRPYMIAGDCPNDDECSTTSYEPRKLKTALK